MVKLMVLDKAILMLMLVVMIMVMVMVLDKVIVMVT